MGDVRACAYVFVILLTCQLIAGKPLFFDWLCDLMCDDDDATSTTASYEDSDYDYCDCRPLQPPTTTPRPGQLPNGMNLMIPPSNGVNLTMSNMNGLWRIDMLPWAGGAPATPAPAAPGPGAATPAPAAPAPAAATTAAPDAAAAPTTVATG